MLVSPSSCIEPSMTPDARAPRQSIMQAETHSEIAPVELPIDRPRAMMRGVWRLCGALLAGAPLFIGWPNWRMLWYAERASCVSFGMIYALVGAITLGLLYSAVRWIVLACRKKNTGIRISAQSIDMQL